MASKRAIRRRQCNGKIRHADRAEAVKAARLAMKIFGEDLHPYACQFCGGWHIGHGQRDAESQGMVRVGKRLRRG